MPHVMVYNREGTEPSPACQISYDGKDWSVLGDQQIGQTLLEDPISVPSEKGTLRLTKKDGELFLKGLQFNYRGTYLWCSSPYDDSLLQEADVSNEPRDDHGKWTKGSGGSGHSIDDLPEPKKPDVDEIAAFIDLTPAGENEQGIYDEQYPNLAKIDFAAANKINDEQISKARKILEKAGTPIKYMAAKNKAAYDKLVARYGAKQAAAIFASGQAIGWGSSIVGTAVTGVPVYIPFSTVVGMVPGAVLAEAYYQIRKKQGIDKSVENKPVEEGKKNYPKLSPKKIEKLGRELLEELIDAWTNYPEHRPIRITKRLRQVSEILGGTFGPQILEYLDASLERLKPDAKLSEALLEAGFTGDIQVPTKSGGFYTRRYINGKPVAINKDVVVKSKPPTIDPAHLIVGVANQKQANTPENAGRVLEEIATLDDATLDKLHKQVGKDCPTELRDGILKRIGKAALWIGLFTAIAVPTLLAVDRAIEWSGLPDHMSTIFDEIAEFFRQSKAGAKKVYRKNVMGKDDVADALNKMKNENNPFKPFGG